MNQRNGNDQKFPAPPPIGGSSDQVARAIADWPLLAMLASWRLGMTLPPADAAIAAEEAAPIFIPPASPPPTASAPVMPETTHSEGPEAPSSPLPAHAGEADAEPARAMAAAAMPEPDAAVRPPSALEQLFNRADKAGQAPPVTRTMFKQSGPPPLKTPGQSAAASADRAPGQTGAVTIEPRPRQWRELETVPDRLFDRVEGR